MRQKVSADRLAQFMKSLGRGEKNATRVYLVGGATAVLLGWREATIDVDLKIVPENDELLRKLPKLKEDLQLKDKLYKYPAIDANSLRQAVERLGTEEG